MSASTKYGRRNRSDGPGAHCLFHVVNIALNVVSTKRLAWQERKAESFTVTPRHCGSAYLGFRPSDEYGERPGRGGITLGTAMAISGAAASPNMGYHSSPSVTLLLALFNVRLGWWLGNPGECGDKSYQTDGPKWAAKPLFFEAFGQTTDESRYVYLSDGGHFENLGLYEMVRRRCRFIVAIDAGCDPDFAFEDLGNAVRKIYIDLGIRIRFDGARGAAQSSFGVRTATATKIPYFAIGTIDYKDADGSRGRQRLHSLYQAGLSRHRRRRDQKLRNGQPRNFRTNRRPTSGSRNRNSKAIARSAWRSATGFSANRRQRRCSRHYLKSARNQVSRRWVDVSVRCFFAARRRSPVRRARGQRRKLLARRIQPMKIGV